MTDSTLNPYLLAANTPDPDPRLLPLLRANPALASKQDEHGYSLLHAAASYNHAPLLRALVNEFNVDVNLKDEDEETCLFGVESLDIARCLVEELKINVALLNNEGMTAADKIMSEEDYLDVAAYLQQQQLDSAGSVLVNGVSASEGVRTHPPPLPANMNVSFSTAVDPTATDADEPDPEFRRRIEELAAKENFGSDEGQQELRQLISDAVRGVNNDERDVRRRTD